MMENEIKRLLLILRESISRSDGQGMADALLALDRMVEERAPELPPRLLHFLQNRSYEKALAHLEGQPNIPAGVCGGIHGQKTES